MFRTAAVLQSSRFQARWWSNCFCLPVPGWLDFGIGSQAWQSLAPACCKPKIFYFAVQIRLLRAPYFKGAPLALLPKIKSAARFALSLRIRSAARARALTIKERRSFCGLKKKLVPKKMDNFFDQNYQMAALRPLYLYGGYQDQNSTLPTWPTWIFWSTNSIWPLFWSL